MYDENGVPIAASAPERSRSWFGKMAQGIIVVALVIAVMRLLIPAEEDNTDVVEPTIESLDASDYYAQGESYFESENYTASIDAYNQAIEAGYIPLDRAYFERGRAEYRLGDYEAAVESYTQSLEVSLECDECYVDYHNRGHAYWELENYEAALDDFTQAIEIKPDYLAAYVSRTKIREIISGGSAQPRVLSPLDVGFDRAATEIQKRTITTGQQRDLEIETSGEQYQFTFSAVKGERVIFSIPSASVDVVLLLRNASSVAVAYDDSANEHGGDELTYVIEKTGHYTLTVAAYSPNGLGDFTLSMDTAEADQASRNNFTDTAETDDLSNSGDSPVIDIATADHLFVDETTEIQSPRWHALAANGLLYADYYDGEVHLYNLEDDTVKELSLDLVSSNLMSLAISPDGTLLAVRSPKMFYLYDLSTSTMRHTIAMDDYYPDPIAFSPDGSIIALTHQDYVALYNTITGKELASLVSKDVPLIMSGFGSNTMAFSADGTQFAAGMGRGVVKIWTMESRRLVHTLETGKVEDIMSVAFSPDGTLIAAGGTARRVYVWDALSGELLHTFTDQRKITDVTFSPDGDVLLSSSEDQTVVIREMNNLNSVVSIPQEDVVTQLVFQADGRTLVTVAEDYKLRLWRVKE